MAKIYVLQGIAGSEVMCTRAPKSPATVHVSSFPSTSASHADLAVCLARFKY